MAGGEDDLYLPRLSPDRTRVFYVIRAKPGAPSNNSRLMRVPITGGPSKSVLEDAGIWDVECIYSRIQAGRLNIFTFDPVNGKGQELRAVGGNFDYCLSPDGQSLAWAKNGTGGKDFGIRAVSLASERYRDIAMPAGLRFLAWPGCFFKGVRGPRWWGRYRIGAGPPLHFYKR
jgi:hypothetical protein